MVKTEPLMDSMHLMHPPQRGAATSLTSGQAGSFMGLHLDPTLLADYESPGFNESTAVAMDDLQTMREAARLPCIKIEQTRDASAVSAAAVASTVSWMLSAMRTPKGDSLCRYRKGKCGNPRTFKKNGDLHSYCEFHRQRSVVNQRKFDRKKREAMEKHLCRGCQEGGACHDGAHTDQRVYPRQPTQAVLSGCKEEKEEAQGSFREAGDGASKVDQSRVGEDCTLVML